MAASWLFDDATASSVDFGDVTAFDGLADISFSAWIYRTVGTNNDTIFGKWGVSQADWTFLIELNSSGRLDFLLGSGSGSNYDKISSSSNISLTTWTYVTATWSNSPNNMYVYFNGVDVTGSRGDAGTGAGASVPNGASQYAIGSRRAASSTGVTFNGNIAYGCVHSKNITLEEHEEQRFRSNPSTSNIVSFIPCVNDTAPVDIILGNVGTITGSNATASLIGPPVSSPQMIGS